MTEQSDAGNPTVGLDTDTAEKRVCAPCLPHVHASSRARPPLPLRQHRRHARDVVAAEVHTRAGRPHCHVASQHLLVVSH
eukprot:1180783-Prorocentrum_minimum.AAC.2